MDLANGLKWDFLVYFYGMLKCYVMRHRGSLNESTRYLIRDCKIWEETRDKGLVKGLVP